MKPVAFPLRLQMKRAEVGDLHQALAFLGFTIAYEEKAANASAPPSARDVG